jgi:tyrosine-protein phosphatase YwqE
MKSKGRQAGTVDIRSSLRHVIRESADIPEGRTSLMAILNFRYKERRRTVRVNLSVPLKVQGQSDSGTKFSVETHSHTVSQHGASVELEMAVVLGEILVIENQNTREKVEGKIATIRHSRDGKTYVGVEFVTPHCNFWHMAFPAPGARPLRRQQHAPAEKVSAALS